MGPGSSSSSSRVLGRTVFPTTRVKRIMRADPDVRNVKPEAVAVMARAAELFVGYIARASAQQARARGRKTIAYQDLAVVVKDDDLLVFLHDIVPQKKTKKEALLAYAQASGKATQVPIESSPMNSLEKDEQCSGSGSGTLEDGDDPEDGEGVQEMDGKEDESRKERKRRRKTESSLPNMMEEVVRREGRPVHYTEVPRLVQETFGRECTPMTANAYLHNKVANVKQVEGGTFQWIDPAATPGEGEEEKKENEEEGRREDIPEQ
eukprot:TRINITY_DN33356_c0_g1_i1.p1 TRINITY_DN33356_c0_g1~~TRINITY_DN33356_c0_g1_i1.p1  ORF type:complete len:278 (-),score=74.66 TRINITY_DN33356_c0_g1_i1:23-814(-)